MSKITKEELLEIAGLIRELHWRSNHAMNPDAWTDDYTRQVVAIFERHGIGLEVSPGPCECEDPMLCYVEMAGGRP
jgi:hypothetical protein